MNMKAKKKFTEIRKAIPVGLWIMLIASMSQGSAIQELMSSETQDPSLTPLDEMQRRTLLLLHVSDLPSLHLLITPDQHYIDTAIDRQMGVREQASTDSTS
jgi:hypothetical protein